MKFYEEPGVPKLSIQRTTNGTELRAGEVDASLKDLFSRPIKLRTFDWVPSTPLTPVIIAPWYELLEDDMLSFIVARYARFRATLRIKVLVNGNGFYFGRLVARYLPRYRARNSANVEYVADTFHNTGTTTPSSAQWVMAKQYPHVVIDPTTTVGAEMTIPMVIPDDWLDLTNKKLRTGIGELAIDQFNMLQHANGATEPLRVTVLGWFEDVELNFPMSVSTSEEVKARGDEYNQALRQPLSISGTLTAVADIAEAAEQVPGLGPFAMATNIVARAGASVAKMFGFSRAPILDSSAPVRPSYMGSLANCDRPENVEKLTINGRQEVCIDSSPMGITTDEDELALATLLRKEGYVGTFSWSPNDSTETQLFTTAVAPNFFAEEDSKYYTTPLCYFSLPFQYWRGSIVFHFEVVASSFHRGRLRVVWDPSTFNLGASYNENFSVVLDISNQRDFYVTIPYGASSTYLDLTNAGLENGTLYGSTPNMQHGAVNGSVTVLVLNELSVMNVAGDNSIAVNVYVKAGHDFKVAKPMASRMRRLAYTAEVESTASVAPASSLQDQVVTHGSNAPLTKNVPSSRVDEVVFGETVTSFRQLLKRYNLSTAIYNPSEPGDAEHMFVTNGEYSTFPPFRGSFDYVRNITGSTDFNYVRTTLLNFLVPCFLGYRGSIRHKFITVRSGLGTNTTFVSLLDTGRSGGECVEGSTMVTLVTAKTARKQLLKAGGEAMDGFGGSACIAEGHNPVLEVEFPHYSNAKYFVLNSVATEAYRDATLADILPAPPMYKLTTVGVNRLPEDGSANSNGAALRSSPSVILDYVAVGEDFSLHFFLATPILYLYNDPL